MINTLYSCIVLKTFTMAKKKITKEDLNLHIEYIGEGFAPSDVTKAIGRGDATNNTCLTNEEGKTCDTTTTQPSHLACQTNLNCNQTNVCNTKACVTQACANTISHGQLCCAYTKMNNCNETVDNCISVVGCDNSKDICKETEYRTCIPAMSKEQCQPVTSIVC